jgi:hypothetical protein
MVSLATVVVTSNYVVVSGNWGVGFSTLRFIF